MSVRARRQEAPLNITPHQHAHLWSPVGSCSQQSQQKHQSQKSQDHNEKGSDATAASENSFWAKKTLIENSITSHSGRLVCSLQHCVRSQNHHSSNQPSVHRRSDLHRGQVNNGPWSFPCLARCSHQAKKMYWRRSCASSCR